MTARTGPITTTGTAWEPISSGYTARRAAAEECRPIAKTSPPTRASTNPRRTSCRVTQVALRSVRPIGDQGVDDRAGRGQDVPGQAEEAGRELPAAREHHQHRERGPPAEDDRTGRGTRGHLSAPVPRGPAHAGRRTPRWPGWPVATTSAEAPPGSGP